MRRTLLACLLLHCSNQPSQNAEGGVDASLDHHSDAGAKDVELACNEASTGTRWQGWSRVTEVDPCCTVEVPDSVTASVDPLTWVPCADAGSGCVEMPVTWGIQPNWTRFNKAWAVHSFDGKPAQIVVIKRLDVDTAEEDVFDFDTHVAIAAWRVYGSTDTAWTMFAAPAAETTWVWFEGTRDISVVGGSMLAHMPSANALHPSSLFPLPTTFDGQVLQDFAASNTTFAFDMPYLGRVVRSSWGSPNVLTASHGIDGLMFPLVHGDDVLAEAPSSDGWVEECRVDLDGTATILRARAQREVANFASDGPNIFWTEAYGTPLRVTFEPIVELWTAPFTNDASTLDTTGHHIANVDGAFGYDASGIAFNGFYAIRTGAGEMTVARGSDGSTQKITSGTAPELCVPVYVDATEVWGLMCDAKVGLVALRRYALAPWP